MAQKTVYELVAELRGTQCQCGSRKTAAKTFCKPCYYSLSQSLRRRLYNRVGEGYEQAYAEAISQLNGGSNEHQETTNPG